MVAEFYAAPIFGRLKRYEIPIKEVKCGCPLKGTHIYFLKQMMERQLISNQDCALI